MTDVAVTYEVTDVTVDVVSDVEVAVTVAPSTEVAVTVEPGGPTGATGAAGAGVPVGGTTGQVLTKASNTDRDTEWTTPSSGGGGGGAVDSVNGRTGDVTGLAEASDLTTETNARAAADTALDARVDIIEAISIATDAELAAAVAAVAAEATLARNADNLTSGTVADARIPSTITRDSEVAGLITTAIDALLDGAPAALDTLNELAAAVDDDASFAASVTTALAGKQPVDADLTAIAALTTTSIGRSLLAAVDDAALRTILGLGSLSTVTPTGTPDGTLFLRDDGVWALPAGGGSVSPLTADLDADSFDIYNIDRIGVGTVPALASIHTATVRTGLSGGQYCLRVVDDFTWSGVASTSAMLFAPTLTFNSTVFFAGGVAITPTVGGTTTSYTFTAMSVLPTINSSITTARLLSIGNSGSGTPTTTVGLDVGVAASLKGSTIWALNVGDYQSYHHGKLTLGATTAPTYALDLKGTGQDRGVIALAEASATPTNPSSGAQTLLYMKGDKLVVAYNDAGTVRYKYLDLTGTGVTWTHTTTAP